MWWLSLAGGALPVLCLLLVALLPLLLPTESRRQPLVPPRTAAPQPVPVAESRPLAVGDDRPDTLGSPSVSPAIEEPVFEQRRVQTGRPSPVPPQTLAGDATQPAAAWDRSSEARQAAVDRFGGTPQTENAVEAGLRWLAAHQSADGTWDRLRFNELCPADDRCPGVARLRIENDATAGVTGLALLAFLGAGYTDQRGPYQDTVARGVQALLTLQTRSGGFSVDDTLAGYNDALATLALAEYYALTNAQQVREPLAHAVQCISASQQAPGGWDYGRSPLSARNDSSIAAWMVQALHAAAAVGIDVSRETMVRAAMHFVRATESDGDVRYSDAGVGFELDNDLRPVYQHGPGMLAAGLTCTQLLGWRLDGAGPRRQSARVQSELPSTALARGRDRDQTHNEYYWYYGTLAMFQRGGNEWTRWNAQLRDVLLPLQERSVTRGERRSHTYGSWPPYGEGWGLFGRTGSRVYTTAICTLTLEIYYRHTPAYMKDQVVFQASDWIAYLGNQPVRERLLGVECLQQLRIEVGEPALIELLADENLRVRLAAAEALAQIDSPLGLGVIAENITTLPPWQRQSLEAAQSRGRAILALPSASGTVRAFDAASGVGTADLLRSYVGMHVTVLRDGQPVATGRVVQRFTGRDVVLYRIDAAEASPKVGDRILSD